MAMTTAERQALYRQRKRAKGERRMEYILSADAVAALERLCERWECTHSQAIERALAMADRRKG